MNSDSSATDVARDPAEAAPSSDGAWYGPTPWEVVTNWPAGMVRTPPVTAQQTSPRAELEALILPTLTAGRAFVSFSGGVDSALVLAVSTRLARREGLEPPIPITKVSPSLPETREDEWQEMTIRHLGLSEWIRVDVTTDNDLIGPRARESLLRNGLGFPAPVHVDSAINEQIEGGSLITGEGGDEVLGDLPLTPLLRWLRDQPWREPSRGVRMVRAVTRRDTEARIRDAVAASGWLRPAARSRFGEELSRDVTSRPLAPAASVRWLLGRRAIRVGQATVAAAARPYDVTVCDALLEPRFVASIARWKRVWRAKGRGATIEALFPDTLPSAVVQRTTKAHFNEVYFGAATRAFAGRWRGDGVDTDLVDVETLRAEWLSDRPSAQTSLLLQSAWLATEGGSADRTRP